MKRDEFDKKTKLAMFKRASSQHPDWPLRVPGRTYCEKCGLDVTGKYFAYDHKVPDWTRSETPLYARETLTMYDGWLLCKTCHDGKTGVEAGQKAKTNRLKEDKARVKTKGSSWLTGKDSQWKKKLDGSIVPRKR